MRASKAEKHLQELTHLSKTISAFYKKSWKIGSANPPHTIEWRTKTVGKLSRNLSENAWLAGCQKKACRELFIVSQMSCCSQHTATMSGAEPHCLGAGSHNVGAGLIGQGWSLCVSMVVTESALTPW